jgi:hypothetical protein
MSTNEHLTPELFIDLLDGAPVAAECRLHLTECAECREELRELEETLGLLRSGEKDERPAPPARASRRYAYLWWAVSAAAVLVAVLLSLDRGSDAVDSSPAARAEEMLLPPIEEDDDFRLLLALSEESEEIDFLDEVNAFPGLHPPDASGLTPGERQNLLEELARDMRSSS